MKITLKYLVLFFVVVTLCDIQSKAAAPDSLHSSWQAKIKQELPLLGHRNWILIVDSAYPLQTSPGVETIETNADQVEVTREVLRDLDHSIHVRPIVYMDAELPFVPEQDAAGVTQYRGEIKAVLQNRNISTLPHEQIIEKIDETGKTFHVLVLKTNLTIPYSSVFLQLDCKYWSDSAEERLRNAMRKSGSK
jgi:RbsD / FucU transport protein family.